MRLSSFPVMTEIAKRAASTFALLRRVQPIVGEYDVTWRGPYFVPRTREWYATRFLLYDHRLFCSLDLDNRARSMDWGLDSGDVRFERDLGYDPRWHDDVELWSRVLEQVVRKLRRALSAPDRYNAFVSRLLPLARRTGRAERRLTWQLPAKPVLPRSVLQSVERLRAGPNPARLEADVTVRRYLEVAAVAYDAWFEEAAGMSAVQKHRRWADTRHGGMLDLDRADAREFRDWFRSKAWSGAHPFEVVFGHPHGIHLWPRFHEDNARWSFAVGAGAEGYYAMAATMAAALAAREVAVELLEGERIVAALRGVDDVEIGPHYDQLPLEQLESCRPDSIALVRWDPIPEIRPITPDQAARVAHVLRTGRPPAASLPP